MQANDGSLAGQNTSLTNLSGDSSTTQASFANRTTRYVEMFTMPQFSETNYLGLYPEYRASQTVRRYLTLIFVLIGTIGNFLTIIVLLRPRMRKKSMFAFLTVLAFADTVELYVLPFRLWLAVMEENTYFTNPAVCKAASYFGYVFSEFSVWILVLVTIERFIVIKNPLGGPLICNVRRAYLAMAVLLAVLCALHAHVLWTYDIKQFVLHEHMETVCGAADGYNTLVVYVWPWVDIFLYSVIPFAIILILNVLLIRKAKGASRKRRLMSQPSTTSGSSSSSSQDEASRLTFMLLTVTFVFLAATLPLCLAGIVMAFRIPYTKDHSHTAGRATHQELASQNLARSLTQSFMFVNHSINFFLYCLTGNKFRQELKQVFGCKPSKPSENKGKRSGSISATMSTKLTSSTNSLKENNRIVRPPPLGSLQ